MNHFDEADGKMTAAEVVFAEGLLRKDCGWNTPGAGMAADRRQRRIAAILAADVVGYSRLMGFDEEATLATLKSHREVIDGLLARHKGRPFGGGRDSVTAEFASPVEQFVAPPTSS